MRIIEDGLILVALAGAALQGCSGSVSSGGEGGGGTTAAGGASTGGAGGTSTSFTGDPVVLAIRRLRMGDLNPNGNPSTTAWQQYGMNIDGKVSAADSVDLCKPAAGAKKSAVYPDGDDGIDNSFGKNILPIWTSLAGDFSLQLNDSIEKGVFTELFRIEGIGPAQTGTSPSQLFGGSMQNGGIPGWQGTDAWGIRSDSFLNGDPAAPMTQFPTAVVELDASGARRWRSVTFDDLILDLPVAGFDMALPIRHARITMVLSDDNAHATVGMIGGIIDTELYISELAKVMGAFDPTLCPPSSTFESIAQQIRQASDILSDGSQDPSKQCDGISIGLGFDADGALLGPVFETVVPPDPCQM